MKRQREESTRPEKLNIDETEEMTLHTLGDKKSWLIVTSLNHSDRPTTEEVEQLWQLRPEAKGRIMMMGKLLETPRYNQTYSDEGKGYRFSGMQHDALPIPALLKRYLEYANDVCRTVLRKDYEGHKFNMVFVNWYENGSHHIGYHSDDEKQLFLNKRGETLVFSISLGQERRFLVKEKKKKNSATKEPTFALNLANHSIVVMGGLCQANYKHSVPKTVVENVGRRLNLTFRIFK